MSWIIVEPLVGRAAGPGSEVTVAWRRAGVMSGNRLIVSVGKSLAESLGWSKGMQLQVSRHLPLGMLRLAPSPPNVRGTSVNDKDGTRSAQIRMDGMEKLTETKRAERAEYERDGSSITLTLPDWAAQERVLLLQRRARGEAANALNKGASLSPAQQIERQDNNEALIMIERGDTNVSIMEQFGWSRDRVEALRAAAPKLRGAAQARTVRHEGASL